MSVELIVWDCDGVLVDSEAVVIEIEAARLRDAGFPLTTEEIADRFVGLSYPDMMAALEADHGRPVPDGLSRRIQDDALAAFPARLRPVEGIADVLDGIHCRQCVGSSSDLDRIDLSLVLTDLRRFFPDDTLFSAEMVERGKPAPDLFLHAASALGVDPARCLVVEDSPHGVTAALEAGMDVIGFLGGSHARPARGDRLRAAGAPRLIEHSSALAAAAVRAG